jgi:hypothetical protein
MTLPTGAITMADVAAELSLAVTGLNLNDARVRAIAGKPSGTISMNDLRGKSAFIFVPYYVVGWEPYVWSRASISGGILTISFTGDETRQTRSCTANVGASEVLSNFEYYYNEAVNSSPTVTTWRDLYLMNDDIVNFNMIGDVGLTVRRKGTTIQSDIEFN